MPNERRPANFLFKLLLLLLTNCTTTASSVSSPWVPSGDATIPDGVIRITTLGSGSPDVRKEQVCTVRRGTLHTHTQPATVEADFRLNLYTCRWHLVSLSSWAIHSRTNSFGTW